MKSVKVLYNGKSIELNNIDTYASVVKELGKNPKDIFYVEVNGRLTDLASQVQENEFQISLHNSKGYLKNEVLWHTSAHVLAQAVHRLYKDVFEAIGPVTQRGFFEDIDFKGQTISPDMFESIETEMKKIIQEDHIIEKYEMTKEKALEYFKDNPYKIANIQKIPEGSSISIYKQGNYEDLCRGPHLYSTGQISIIQLTSVSSAYFQGDSSQNVLQRISGISFVDKKEQKQHELFMQEAKKRDHRKIGQELELFFFNEAGTGFPFWLPNGTILFNLLINYMREENTKRAYTEVKTPQILIDSLWKQSGHYDNFKENMYFTTIDERSFAIKPMNCPGGCLVFKSKRHSYRDLPLRQAEFGLVHRHEISGALHGLFRVRSFTQDDAHIFCTLEQLQKEVENTIQYTLDVYKTLGFNETQIFVSTRPEKSIGSDEEWEYSTQALFNSLSSLHLDYSIKDKEGAFYGPKIEFNIKDSLGRFWQCGTVQVDFSMPKRFDLFYEGGDGQQHSPTMIHRAIFGSLERFIGIMIEHYEGKLPVWISPIQIQLVNIGEAHLEYLETIKKKLLFEGIRVQTDTRAETLGYKIRHARHSRIPFIGIIGDEEVAKKTVMVRDNREGENISYSVSDLVELIKNHRK